MKHTWEEPCFPSLFFILIIILNCEGFYADQEDIKWIAIAGLIQLIWQFDHVINRDEKEFYYKFYIKFLNKQMRIEDEDKDKEYKFKEEVKHTWGEAVVPSIFFILLICFNFKYFNVDRKLIWWTAVVGLIQLIWQFNRAINRDEKQEREKFDAKLFGKQKQDKIEEDKLEEKRWDIGNGDEDNK